MGVRSFIRRFRSAITGRFVTKSYAERHTGTTVSETQETRIDHPQRKRRASHD